MELTIEQALQQAIEAHQAGQIQEADRLYTAILKVQPDHPDTNHNMGILGVNVGQLEKAIPYFEKATQANPNIEQYWLSHIQVLIDLKRKNDALTILQQAHNSGQQGDAFDQLQLQINQIEQTIVATDPPQQQLQPIIDNYQKGQLKDALPATDKLLQQYPTSITLLNIKGAIHGQLEQLDQAINCFLQVIKMNPEQAEAYSNLGVVYKDQGNLQLAMLNIQKAIEIKPDFAEAYNNLGNAQDTLHDYEAAIRSFERAASLKPDYVEALVQRVHLQSLICDWESLRKERQLIPSLGTGENEVSPFSMLTLEDYPERHKSRAEVYTARKFNHVALEPNARPTAKPAQLRIGYFSADFYDHPVSQLIVGVLEQHDRTQFTVYAYAYGPEKNDDVRQRLIKATDTFRDVSDKNYQEIALLARQDNIDIAIDLTGYTKNCRTAIFAYRAAPIQINYLGYPGTMGAHFMDYIIADKILIPDELKKHYTEKIIQLPYSYMPTDNTRKISNKVITRSDMGLPENGFVFCGFNNSYKISPSEFDIWMRLLFKIPDSVLWLRHSNKWSEDNLRNEAEKRTIDQSRLIFAERIPMDEHLARHQLADLFLDTFTFNAHSTTVDALWAGLPVITKPGQGFAARVAASLLNAINMPELVTHTEQEYETLALELASNPEKLKQIKHKLKINRLTTPLFDTLQYTRYLENGYQKAYQQFFNNQKPDNLYVHG